MATKQINIMDVKVGMIVHAHSSRFEITSVSVHTGTRCSGELPVTAAKGKFIDGKPIRGYFGPEQDWTFQGNERVTLTIEA